MKKNLKMIFLLASFISFNAFAFAPNPKDDALKLDLFKIAMKNHKALGYNPAKKALFGQLHLEKGPEGYFVKDLYCEINYTKGVGPGNMPDQNQLNCEHTWPQSKFTKAFPNELQKSDLHHLFPTDSKANSTRGNFEFADVVKNENLSNCDASRSGASVTSGGHTYFEPPTSHKGNVARAIFYFSIRYKMPIGDAQEEFLRRWNQLDPVDDAEMARNNAIEKLQGNRNPFIDHPELIDQISDF
ncbi:endonuclease I [Bacteriovorax stolpii]|nr:endonuclease [Bacteriovorax stolpii]TDP55400.1 endonuclease I [Bacteriovorax stolpii]